MLKDDDGGSVLVTVKVSKQAMLFWALQYGQSVEILEPKSLREEIRDAVASMWEKYK